MPFENRWNAFKLYNLWRKGRERIDMILKMMQNLESDGCIPSQESEIWKIWEVIPSQFTFRIKLLHLSKFGVRGEVGWAG